MGTDFSAAVVPVPADLLLFVLLSNFSPFAAMTKSESLSSLRCLRLIQNQNRPNDANRTTATGTTIAGIRVLKFDEDFGEAFDDVAEGVLEDVREGDEVEWTSAAVREAYWAGSVMAEVMIDVLVDSPELRVTLSMNSWVVVIVVSTDAEVAKAKLVKDGSESPGLPIDEGRPLGGPCGALRCRPWRAMTARV